MISLSWSASLPTVSSLLLGLYLSIDHQSLRSSKTEGFIILGYILPFLSQGISASRVGERKADLRRILSGSLVSTVGLWVGMMVCT